MKYHARSEDPTPYVVSGNDDHVIQAALAILAKRMRKVGNVLLTPESVKTYTQLKLADKPHEVFSVLFLDCKHGIIEFEEMFRGTLTQTSVYPREVALRALQLNASAVVLAHNHPSGDVQPSRADEVLTQTMKTTLALIDVRVLDHIVVSAVSTLSMAERGLM